MSPIESVPESLEFEVFVVELSRVFVPLDARGASIVRLKLGHLASAIRSLGLFATGMPRKASDFRASAVAHLDLSGAEVNSALKAFLVRRRESGARIVLHSSLDEATTNTILEEHEIFDEVVYQASKSGQGRLNGDALSKQLGTNSIVYIGRTDKTLHSDDSQIHFLKSQTHFPIPHDENPPKALLWSLLRIRHWVKNLLVLSPVIFEPTVVTMAGVGSLILFAAFFSFAASATYMLNDIADIQNDLRHPKKRSRPLPGGQVSVTTAAFLASLILTLTFGSTFLVFGPEPSLFLGVYVTTSVVYSVFLKKVVVLDMLVLTFLYALRVFSGLFLLGLNPTEWLTGFLILIFISLASVKRYVEIREVGEALSTGRGYLSGDRYVLSQIGVSAGFGSVVVFMLYLFATWSNLHPFVYMGMVSTLAYWILHMWVQTIRGTVTTDPVSWVFADAPSLASGALLAVGFASAKLVL